ncbi:glycosyltransferase [Aphanizomenon sp. CS-733/32]|uniref:glycosyltransferase n=1 Tax=Aphanizomenon sp. CS-733/32 TaxID=3021715 RepID=UPI00232E5D73|nr:glycosyltransferase [Aphanizomenon sp. CS-733/32]MDB9308633.1 glycosyltransferase [Aphanizomenon sp. CS-733/32]
MRKTNNIRIVHLSKYYPPDRGGIETHIQTLARTQAAMGAEVHVICVNGFDEQGHLATKTRTVYEMDGNVKITRLGRFLSVARFDICSGLCKKINKFANKPNTIFHLHTPNPTMLMALTMLDRKIPLVITHHSDVIKQKILKYGLRPFEHLVYNQSSRILTTSSQYIQGSKFLRFYPHKLNALPLGLDIETYKQPNQEALAYSRSLQEEHGDTIWLAVGRLVYYKALHIAIQALTRVQGKLVIIGVGSLESKLRALAQKLGVENRIVWLGHVSEDELVGAYHAATALWFPSNVRSEGFGLVQVEAMASGCPVINANIPCSGVSWVSRHEKEGLTVPINDPVAFAQAANRLLVEPGLHNRLVKASRNRAEYFNHISMGERSLEIYDNVLSQELNYTMAQAGNLP